MDERIEPFLHEALTHGSRESVSVLLANYRRGFPDISLSSCRQRVPEEIEREKGTPEEHQLRLILEIIDKG